jgi:hypothetical protein
MRADTPEERVQEALIAIKNLGGKLPWSDL